MKQPIGDLFRLVRTVRHLRFEQVHWQIRRRLVRPRVDSRPAPPVRVGVGLPAPTCAKAARSVGGLRFDVLGSRLDVRRDGWDPPGTSELLRYNLHYFDWLESSHDGDACHAVSDWVDRNPPGQGIGWHPYPTSLRIVNWLKREWRRPFLDERSRHSLVVQARCLAASVERHILGNHVIANGKALAFAAAAFEGEDSVRFAAEAHKLLMREIPEQVLADGGHFELSPMYHAIVLEDFLDLENLARGLGGRSMDLLREIGAEAGRRIPGMLRWLACMTHPDGGPAFFNDCGIGIGPSLEDLERYARRLGVPGPVKPLEDAIWLTDSGFVRLCRGDAVAIADFGSVGPDYIPGHAHADTLSVELSLGAHRVLVNSGTSEYGHGPERSRQRGTPAHNTVSIGGRDSSEVWGGFRVGRRAHVHGVSVVALGDRLEVDGRHDGYRFLPGSPRHRRTISLRPGCIEVVDEVGAARDAIAHWHFGPGVEVSSALDRLQLPGGREVSMSGTDMSRARAAPSQWHAAFGRSMPSVSLSIPIRSQRCGFRLDWNLV